MMAETYEEKEESYLQAVGSAAWDAGVEAGEWIQWGWSQTATGQAMDTAQAAYGQAAQTFDDYYTSAGSAVTNIAVTAKEGVENLGAGVKDVVEKAVENIADVTKVGVEETADVMKAVPYLVAGVGGLAIYLHYSKKKR